MLSRPEVYLGLDAGTSSCKAALVDDSGAVLARATAPYRVQRDRDGRVTGNATDWLEAVGLVSRECSATVGEKVSIVGVALTAPAHGAVLVGKDAAPLGPVLSGSDRRPSAIAAELARKLGPRLHDITWCTPGPGWTLPQLAWLRRSGEVAWGKIFRVLVAKDYLRYRLTGEVATDPSDAVGTAFFDPARMEWVVELLDEAGLRLGQLPDVLPSTAVAGRLTREAASSLGLLAGTPVATGASDTVAELCGLGATAPGSGLVKVASTGTVVTVTEEPHPDPRWLTYPHAVAGRWASFTVHNTAGTARTWAEAQFRDDWTQLDQRASEALPGSDGLFFIPFLEGERSPYWDGDIRGGFVGLTSAHSQAHLVRAVLEGVAFALRMGREVMQQGKLKVTAEPYLSGGGMESGLWRQIVVDVLGRRGRYAPGNGPAFGSALMARTAVSGQALPEDCLSRTIQVDPCPHAEDEYRSSYRVYAQLADLFARLKPGPMGMSTDNKDTEVDRAGRC